MSQLVEEEVRQLCGESYHPSESVEAIEEFLKDKNANARNSFEEAGEELLSIPGKVPLIVKI